MQEVLTVPNEVAAELAGIGDGLLDTLRERLGCTISLRGNRLTLDGDDERVVEARAVVDELVQLVEGGHAIGPDTVGAVVAALDIGWLLRLGGWPRGRARLLTGVVATAAIVAVANWWITATQLGMMLGIDPWNSALRLGWHHAWTLIQLANGALDLVWIAVGLVVAAWLSR